MRPLVDDGEEFLAQQEALPDVDPRALLESYFDFYRRHREEIAFLLAEPATLAELDLFELVPTWRGRLAAVVFGPEPTLAQAARATVAFGGLQDCTIQFSGVPADELREAAVHAACAALGFTQ